MRLFKHFVMLLLIPSLVGWEFVIALHLQHCCSPRVTTDWTSNVEDHGCCSVGGGCSSLRNRGKQGAVASEVASKVLDSLGSERIHRGSIPHPTDDCSVCRASWTVHAGGFVSLDAGVSESIFTDLLVLEPERNALSTVLGASEIRGPPLA